MLRQYIRGENGQRTGVVVALPNVAGNRFNVGWAIAREDEPFDRDFLVAIAVGRAVLGQVSPVPRREVDEITTYGKTTQKVKVNVVEVAINEMIERAKRYYKEKV
jgi:hypothetical protein